MSIMLSGGSFIFPREVLLGPMILLCLMSSGKVFIPSKKLTPIVVLLFGIFILMLFFHDSFTFSAFVTRYSVFIGSLFVYNVYTKTSMDDFHMDLYTILKLMPYQAILTVILTILVPALFVALPVFDSSGALAADYQTIGFVFTYHTVIEGLQGLKRPDGLFFEPGVFQFYLNLFLYLCLFVYKKRWYTVVAMIGVLTTQSTMGMVISLLMITYYVFIEQKGKGFLLRVRYLFFGVIILVPLILVTQSNVNDKLTGDQRGSTWSRQYDLITGLKIVAENPFTGIGFDYGQFHKIAGRLGDKNTQLDINSTTDKNNTNGIVFLLYSIGIPLAIPFLIGIFRSSLFKHKFLIGVIIFLSLNTESLIYTPFFLLLIYSGISPIVYGEYKKRVVSKRVNPRTGLRQYVN